MSIAAVARMSAFIVGAMVFASSVWALDRNGNWWLTLAERDRPIYMIGFFDGMEFELDRAGLELAGLLSPMQYPQPCDTACTKLRLDQSFTNWKNLQKGYGDFDNVTAGQLVAGVDAMYMDYRNRTISVKEILSVVIWSIKGVDQKMIDGRLMYLRGQK